MCGITGFVIPLQSSDYRSKLDASFRCIDHRGPDDTGFEEMNSIKSKIVFGHKRLSIIDLSQAGHQPMSSANGRFTVVYNGEIYNYKELREELKTTHGYQFKSDSDTEVLLAAWDRWGDSSLKKFVGMFAFAMYDSTLQKLFLVRDAFGIKPLYCSLTKESFHFSSEVPALISFLPQTKLNHNTAYNYVLWGQYDTKEETFYKDVFHLLPGHLLEVDVNNPEAQLKKVRWWWPSVELKNKLTFDDAAKQLREMFLGSVKLHLRSDVPIGAALSGGIDSSAVVCAMRMIEPDMPIHTFSFIAPNSSINEENWIDIVNEYVNAIPHKISVDPSELISDIDDMIQTQGEPFGSTSIYAQYRVFKAAREAGIVVTLDGQGADELLAGYNGYPSYFLKSMFENNEYNESIHFLRNWASWPGRSMKQSCSMFLSNCLPINVKKSILPILTRKKESDWVNQDWINRRYLTEIHSELENHSNEAKGRRLVEQLRSALTGNGLASLLRHGDRNAMRWSIESRVPFLTIEMAEFLLSLPEDYLLSRKGETKHIFREAMRGIVPDEILDRRDKIGFQTPELDWLKNNKNAIENWLGKVSETPFLNEKNTKREIERILNGTKSFDYRVWRTINYSRWLQIN